MLMLVPFRKCRKDSFGLAAESVSLFLIRSGNDAFGKREKAEETRWARRFVSEITRKPGGDFFVLTFRKLNKLPNTKTNTTNLLQVLPVNQKQRRRKRLVNKNQEIHRKVVSRNSRLKSDESNRKSTNSNVKSRRSQRHRRLVRFFYPSSTDTSIFCKKKSSRPVPQFFSIQTIKKTSSVVRVWLGTSLSRWNQQYRPPSVPTPTVICRFAAVNRPYSPMWQKQLLSRNWNNSLPIFFTSNPILSV